MRKPKNYRASLIVAVLGLLAISPLCVSCYREYQHERLNHDLVLAIKGQDSDRALALLSDGAEGKVRQSDGNPVKFINVFTRGLGRLFHLSAAARTPLPTADNPGALYLFFRAALDSEHGRHSAPTVETPKETLPLALLKAGCEVKSDGFGQYCLYGAVHFHHRNVVVQLLNCGVQAAASTRLTLGSLLEANADDAQSLIEHGADVDMRDADGDTALFRADSLKAVALLNAHAQVEARNALGQTPLIDNCTQGNDDSVLVLLARSANVSARDLHGATPFLAAAAHCRLETLKALAHAGADIHARKKDGTTALMYALYNSDDRVFTWLLNRSFDLNAHGMGDNTVLSIAQQLRIQTVSMGNSPARYDLAIRELVKRGSR